MKNPLRTAAHEVLSGPYTLPNNAHDMKLSPAVMDLARSQVHALLCSSPAFYRLSAEQRRDMEANMLKIAAYTASLYQQDFALSKKLGQTPVLRQQASIKAPITSQPMSAKTQRIQPLATAAAAKPNADEFSPRAASQVATITKQTLNAIAFPTFVADLIKGTFQAIVDASIQQMEAYGGLLANVAKTVDQFMADNVTDNQARDYLAATYPGHFRVDTSGDAPRIRVRSGADDLAKPDFKSTFGLNEDVDVDDDVAEEVLVPAARRKIAQNRHQMLATMVLMGINRIVVTSGKIRAKMGFRIDASDTGEAQSASQFDWKNETTASYSGGLAGWLFGGPKVKMRNTVAYVSSTKKESSDELNVEADLTGEVDLKFKSDYFPLERFADTQAIALIQGNTAVPQANTPTRTNVSEAGTGAGAGAGGTAATG